MLALRCGQFAQAEIVRLQIRAWLCLLAVVSVDPLTPRSARAAYVSDAAVSFFNTCFQLKLCFFFGRVLRFLLNILRFLLCCIAPL